MNLQKLFKTQKILDDRIVEEKGLHGQDLLPEKILALQVELGELANELPETFKFWSSKKNNYEKALEEYCDCLHFILSIGNDANFTRVELIDIPATKDITYQFLNMYNAINLFVDYRGVGNYRDLISVFSVLGKQLGFTWEQIETAYFEKNAENHARQENGY